MFTREGLDRLLDLQRRSYALFQWVNARVQAGTLRVEALHGSLDAGTAAAEWLRRNMSVLPVDARPPDGELEALAHLFASFLTTSFEVASVKRVSAGCSCGFCTFLVAVPNLRARNPSSRDQQLADQLKLDCLEEFASALELPLFRAELEPVLGEGALRPALAMVTWARELLRRSTFRGQGTPVLALWREFAWMGRRPDRKFELTTDRVLEAEAMVAAALRSRGC
jgi:hypothetical protein